MTAADGERSSMDTTLACFRGYADCVDGAVEKGIIYGMRWERMYSLREVQISVLRRGQYFECSNSELLCNFGFEDYNICGGGNFHGNKEYYI